MMSNIIIAVGTVKLSETCQNIYIKKCSNSFGVNRFNNTFVQRFSTKAFMESLIAINKEDYVKFEMMKALNALKSGREYKANSHLKTIKGLKKLSKEGFIEGFEYNDSGKRKSYLCEKVLVGNFKKSKLKEKHKNYNLKFAKTGKYMPLEYIHEQLKNPEMFKVKRDKNNNISNIKFSLSKNISYRASKFYNEKKKLGLQMIHNITEKISAYQKEKIIVPMIKN